LERGGIMNENIPDIKERRKRESKKREEEWKEKEKDGMAILK
jgi:hypothetical protein